MKKIQDFLNESLLSGKLDKDMDSNLAAEQLKDAFKLDNKAVGDAVSVKVNGNAADIKITKLMDIEFRQKLSSACRKHKINTVNISGVRSLYLQDATNLTLNVKAESVLFGGYGRNKSVIKDCVLNCEKVRIEKDEMGKKSASNTTINAKTAKIDSATYNWSGCSVKAGKVIIPYIKFLPTDMNRYVKGLDFKKDFDYRKMKPTKKTNWSPEDLFGNVNIDSNIFVLSSATNDWLMKDLGANIKVDPKVCIYYMARFVKGGSKEFGGYELKFDKISDDRGTAVSAYIDKL